MADRIVVIREGTIEQIAAPEELFANPACAWVCDFIGAGNLLRGPLVPVGAGACRMEIGPGSVFEVDAPAQPGEGVLFVPSDRVRLTPAAAGQGLTVTARRYLGLSVELQVAHAHGTLTTQVAVDRAEAFPVGAVVAVTADRADCRLLPDR